MPDRPLRADARRNRDRLIAVAVEEFAASPEVTLEVVAKHAGVGIGTLYRHFPTREALVEEAYRHELDRLCDAAGELLAELPPARALRVWMDRFLDYMTTKQGMSDALQAVIASGGDPFSHSRERMTAACALLLAAGVEAGELRADVEPGDLLLSLAGTVSVAFAAGSRERVGRLLDLNLDGLRATASAPRVS